MPSIVVISAWHKNQYTASTQIIATLNNIHTTSIRNNNIGIGALYIAQYLPESGSNGYAWQYFYFLSYSIYTEATQISWCLHTWSFDSHSTGKLVLYTCIYLLKMNTVLYYVPVSTLASWVLTGASNIGYWLVCIAFF